MVPDSQRARHGGSSSKPRSMAISKHLWLILWLRVPFSSRWTRSDRRRGNVERSAVERFAAGRIQAQEELRKADPLLKKQPFSVHLASLYAEGQFAGDV